MALLAISPAQMEPLLSLLPTEFVQVYQRTGEVPASDVLSKASVLQQGLKDLVANFETKFQGLNQAAMALEEYGNAAVTSLSHETEELGLLMNRWLENLALADILEKENQLLEAVQTAKQKDYVFEKDVEPLLVRATEMSPGGDRHELLRRVQATRDELRRRIVHYGAQRQNEGEGRGHQASQAIGGVSMGIFGRSCR